MEYETSTKKAHYTNVWEKRKYKCLKTFNKANVPNHIYIRHRFSFVNYFDIGNNQPNVYNLNMKFDPI